MQFQKGYWALGVHFFPGKFYQFFGWPQSLFTDEQQPVKPEETDLRQEFRDLEEQLQEAQTPAAKVERINAFLISHLPGKKVTHWNADPLVQAVYLSHGNIKVCDLARMTRLSERHFRRLFKEGTGLPAPTFIRISRFYQAFWRILSGQYSSLTWLAQEGGYFDQAHLIRDFRFYTGQSPRQFVKDHHYLTEHLAWTTRG
ncbi:MAG: AraC family transcriptional regulator [Haliscomenobacter sp.]|nr:AraC family transcriptional regulator [Haliscomenobacter sp.]MBK8654532.1 AraC family transcriptional regulator [Haliscomenobacter sp.]